MSLLLALALSVLQDPAPHKQVEAPTDLPPQVASWWEKLDENKREEFRERFERYKNLSPEAKEALHKRSVALEAERDRMVAELEPEQRQELAAMTPEARQQALDRMLRKRLHANKQRLAEEMPGAEQALRGRPFHERVRESGRLLEERHRPMVLEQLHKAGEEGWLGPVALSWFEQAPIEHAYEALGHVRKWRMIERMTREGSFEAKGFDQDELRKLFAMPPHDFGRVMRRLRYGASKEEALQGRDESGDRDWGEWRGRRGGRGDRNGDRSHNEEGRAEGGPPMRR